MLIVLREKKGAQELLGNRRGQQEVPWRIISNVAYASLMIQGAYSQLVSLFNTKIKNCPEPLFHEILHLKEPLLGSLAFLAVQDSSIGDIVGH